MPAFLRLEIFSEPLFYPWNEKFGEFQTLFTFWKGRVISFRGGFFAILAKIAAIVAFRISLKHLLAIKNKNKIIFQTLRPLFRST